MVFHTAPAGLQVDLQEDGIEKNDGTTRASEPQRRILHLETHTKNTVDNCTCLLPICAHVFKNPEDWSSRAMDRQCEEQHGAHKHMDMFLQREGQHYIANTNQK